MDRFEEDVKYFTDLVYNNIKNAREKKGGKIQTVFNGLNISKDGEGVLVYNFDKDYGYELWKKDIENFKFDVDLTKTLALYYIARLNKYDKKEITFEELAGINTTPPNVAKLLNQKSTISEQLKLLRKNRNIPEVQKYINDMYEDKYTTEYVKYLINKYFYNKQNLIKDEKNSLEKMGK